MASEFSFIHKIRTRAAQAAASAVLGIGDDTAILREDSSRERLITTDLLIEDIHFKLEYTPFFALGYKTLAVSLSDIAAMGGKPEFSLLSLGIPKAQVHQPGWEDFFAGYFSLAEKFGVALVGGDTSASPDKLVLDSIVMGSCENGKAIRRSGAQVGDAIYVTGKLGASAAGLQLFLNGHRFDASAHDPANLALRSHLMPTPRVQFGQKTGAANVVHAMMDVSDGLAQDLMHICTESGVDALLDFHAIPIDAAVKTVTPDPEAAFSLAIYGGEDYELLLTADETAEIKLVNLAQDVELNLTRIGTILARPDPAATPRILLQRDGHVDLLTVKGYDHFLR